MVEDVTSSEDDSSDELVTATTYVRSTQYADWKAEAAKRGTSISSFISTRVEAGRRNIKAIESDPSEMDQLRHELQQYRTERDALRRQLEAKQDQDYHVGLGKIEQLINNNPGIRTEEVILFVSENAVKFVDKYLSSVEMRGYVNQNGQWFAPDHGDNHDNK